MPILFLFLVLILFILFAIKISNLKNLILEFLKNMNITNSIRVFDFIVWLFQPSILGKMAGGKILPSYMYYLTAVRREKFERVFFVVSIIFVLSIINFFRCNAAKKFLLLLYFSLPGDNRLICLICSLSFKKFCLSRSYHQNIIKTYIYGRIKRFSVGIIFHF